MWKFVEWFIWRSIGPTGGNSALENEPLILTKGRDLLDRPRNC